ncbi:MAG: electron transfer flavoprotein subunit beta/FixA family protein [Magnetococcales bacterium]|nr:electron transfer flavoprotein subunit beta/FixA family protein [Magnetococcales bacterium]
MAIKQVPDPAMPVRARADGLGVEIDDVRWLANPMDDNALEAALELREAGVVQVVSVVAVGPAAWEGSLRTALAMGADRAIRIDAPDPVDPLPTARALAAWLAREDVALVLTGRQAVDQDQGQVGILLAGLLGWGQIAFATALAYDYGSGQMGVTREVEGGQEQWWLPLPGVITVDPRINTPRYATLPAIMRTRSKPVEVVSAHELGVEWSSDLERLAVLPARTRPPGVRVRDVSELLTQLQARGLLLCPS